MAHIGSNMYAHVLSNLLNSFRKRNKMFVKSRILSVGETTNIWPFLKYNVLRGQRGEQNSAGKMHALNMQMFNTPFNVQAI